MKSKLKFNLKAQRLIENYAKAYAALECYRLNNFPPGTKIETSEGLQAIVHTRACDARWIYVEYPTRSIYGLPLDQCFRVK
jgi:hypothetical protein